MLDNELYGIDELLEQIRLYYSSPFSYQPSKAKKLYVAMDGICARGKRNWSLALFSDRGNESLKRYFSWHQVCITDALDEIYKIFCLDIERDRNAKEHLYNLLKLLLSLWEYLISVYPTFCDADVSVPGFCFKEFLETDVKKWMLMASELNQYPVDNQLWEPLHEILDALMRPEASHLPGIQTMRYLNKLFDNLHKNLEYQPDELLEDRIVEMYVSLNFNHVGFLLFYQQRFNLILADLNDVDRVKYLRSQQKLFFLYQQKNDMRFDPLYPPVYQVIYQWLKEEEQLTLSAHSEALTLIPSFKNQRLVLDIPASYMALFIRLIYTAGWCKGTTLTSFFKFVAAHFESKRMANISWRSLSKEYYSVTQHTAARVRQMLTIMIGLIDRQYFSVLAAATVVIHFL